MPKTAKFIRMVLFAPSRRLAEDLLRVTFFGSPSGLLRVSFGVKAHFTLAKPEQKAKKTPSQPLPIRADTFGVRLPAAYADFPRN